MSFFQYMLSFSVKDSIYILDKVSTAIFIGVPMPIVEISKMVASIYPNNPIDNSNSVYLFFNAGLLHGIMGCGHSASPLPSFTRTQHGQISFKHIFSKSIKSNF